MNRRIMGAVVLVIVGTALLAVYLLPPGDTVPTPPSDTRPTTATVRPSAAALAPLRDPVVVVVDGKFDDRAVRQVRAPTGLKNQSKLWFADGSWWGVLLEPTSREARIQRLDWATQRWYDTGVVVDERPFARADALFDGTNLYVASAGTRAYVTHAVRVSRFSYDPVADRWSLDPDFPVRINETGVESVIIERSSNGTLWVSYVAAGRLQVARSLGDDHRWGAPFTPRVTGTSVATDQVGMAAFGDRIGLLWSNQNDESIYFTSHRNGDPDSSWAEATTVVSGLRSADNHVNVKALPDGRLFAAVKTSLDTVPNNQPGWDQVLLLAREPGGRWISRQFGQIRDKHTRPIVLLDTADDEVLVLATAPAPGGAIYMKRAPFDDLRVPVGVGTPVVQTTPDARINDATSTKQPLDATTGFVVLASDDSTGRYVHAAASLGGPPPGRPDPAAPLPDGPVPAPPDPVLLVADTFDSFVVGEPPGRTWELMPGRADGTLTIVTRDGQDLAVQARTRGSGDLRSCRGFAAGTAGIVTIEADVRVDRLGQADATLLMARGDGRELGGILVNGQGRVRVAARDRRETTRVSLTPGTWYRIALRLDVAGRRYDVTMSRPDGRELLRRTRMMWRSADATLVDSVCFEAPAGAAGLGLSIDDVRVVRVP